MPDNTKFSRVVIASLLAVMLLVAGCTGCQHNNPNFTPAQNATINAYKALDTVVTIDNTVLRAAVTLDATGTIAKPVAKAIIDYGEQVNEAAKVAYKALDGNLTPQQKAAAVLEAVKKLDLPPPVKAFLASSPNGEAVLSLVNNIVLIQQEIARLRATPPASIATERTEVAN